MFEIRRHLRIAGAEPLAQIVNFFFQIEKNRDLSNFLPKSWVFPNGKKIEILQIFYANRIKFPTKTTLQNGIPCCLHSRKLYVRKTLLDLIQIKARLIITRYSRWGLYTNVYDTMTILLNERHFRKKNPPSNAFQGSQLYLCIKYLIFLKNVWYNSRWWLVSPQVLFVLYY